MPYIERANIFGCDVPRAAASLTADPSSPVELLADAAPPQLDWTWLGAEETANEGFTQAMQRLYAANGFGSKWIAQMLSRGAHAIAIFDSQVKASSIRSGNSDPMPRCIAGGLLISEDFYVDEIRRTIRLSCESKKDQPADYYFGDWVDPAYRGRRLQRWLIGQRLLRSMQRGRRWAYAMASPDNAPSVRSYLACGFDMAARISCRRWRRWQLDRVKNLSKPSGSPGISLLSTEGLRLPGGMYLRRSR